jgi:hypothetical protein
MLTKTQFCKMIIKDFERVEGRKITEADIYQSSTLAVAMEHMGLLKTKSAQGYAFSRGGTIYMYYDEDEHESYHLNARELLSLLPEQED